MKIFKTEKAKDNTAKVFYDLFKITIAIMVLAPFAKQDFDKTILMVGLLIALLFWAIAYYIDIREV